MKLEQLLEGVPFTLVQGSLAFARPGVFYILAAVRCFWARRRIILPARQA